MLGLSPEHSVVLLVAALFILGPERLPGAIAAARKIVQNAKNVLAHEQISSKIGPELEQLRKPLGELNQLRSLDPRTALARFVLDPAAVESPAPKPSPTRRAPGVDREAAVDHAGDASWRADVPLGLISGRVLAADHGLFSGEGSDSSASGCGSPVRAASAVATSWTVPST